MVESSFSQTVLKSPAPSSNDPIDPTPAFPRSTQIWMSRWVLGMAGMTLFLMALGSATRVMNAGLSCPDWPLCYGELVPKDEMNLQVFLEWFHRLIASVMGMLSISLVAVTVWKRQSLPQWMPMAATIALGLVIFQGILGGLTVTELLRFDIVTAHLGTGLLFFGTLLATGLLLLPSQPLDLTSHSRPGRIAWMGVVAASCVYLQSLLGGLVASQWALHQCLASQDLCVVMNSHLMGVVPATLIPLSLVVWVWLSDLSAGLKQLGYLIGGCVVLQLALGILTFKLRLQVEPLTVAHQAVGAMLLGVLIAFTVFAFKEKAWQPSSQS